MTRKPATGKPRSATPGGVPIPHELLDATAVADVAKIPARKVLAYEGNGAPESEAFQKAIGAIYGVAYTLKFARKRSGLPDFKIAPLEGRWWSNARTKGSTPPPRESWAWQLRIAMPDDVTRQEVAAAIREATGKKGGKLEHSDEATHVALERLASARVGRALHVGPYADEPRTFRLIEGALAGAGLEPALSHIEVYLSDPRRTPPARLKTVLLREVRP